MNMIKCSKILNNIKIVKSGYNIKDEYDKLYREIENTCSEEDKKQIEKLKTNNQQKITKKKKTSNTMSQLLLL